jgi:hypothetical protein
MPEITDLLDVSIEELSPEQHQQLVDAVNQFQQKLTGTSLSLCACEAKLFGLLCDWR